jgi:octaprenyl-diphosphate synthase
MDLGMAFQLVDDALDYNASVAELGKTIGDDFREGKLTYPVLLAIAEGNGAETEFWSRTIGEGEQTEADLATALTYISRHNTIDRTIQRAQAFAASASEALNALPENPIRDTMQDVAAYTTARRY